MQVDYVSVVCMPQATTVGIPTNEGRFIWFNLPFSCHPKDMDLIDFHFALFCLVRYHPVFPGLSLSCPYSLLHFINLLYLGNLSLCNTKSPDCLWRVLSESKLMFHFILFSATYPGRAHGGNSLNRDIQLLFFPSTSTSFSEGTPRHSQACWEI